MSGRAAHGVLVVDVGTTSVRAALVLPDGGVSHVHHAPLAGSVSAPGLAEFDAAALAGQVLELAGAVVDSAGTPLAVGVASQRASTVVWDRSTGVPVAPAIGWQDLRTVFTCLELQAQGIRLAPNMSATKLAAILDVVDPDRRRGDELCFGTVDAWVAWTLAGGAGRPGGGLHVTDATNVAVTGLVTGASGGSWEGWEAWDGRVLEALRIPPEMLPRVVDTSGALADALALPGAPPICALVGDQQASLWGQGCTRPGLAKATFGTGGMLDLCSGPTPPKAAQRAPAGTYPIVAWRRGDELAWGAEAIMLTAGSCVEWLRDDLGLITTAAESAEVAGRCDSAGDVWFVPAFMGLGTPVWDFGARGTLLGLSSGAGRCQVVRAVLEGVAHRGADLLEAAEADTGLSVPSLRVDGGMSANDVFVQALADACGRPVELSSELEATTRGAGLLAALAIGLIDGPDAVADAIRPRAVVDPRLAEDARLALRARWRDVRSRAERTLPDLSGIDF